MNILKYFNKTITARTSYIYNLAGELVNTFTVYELQAEIKAEGNLYENNIYSKLVIDKLLEVELDNGIKKEFKIKTVTFSRGLESTCPVIYITGESVS